MRSLLSVCVAAVHIASLLQFATAVPVEQLFTPKAALGAPDMMVAQPVTFSPYQGAYMGPSTSGTARASNMASRGIYRRAESVAGSVATSDRMNGTDIVKITANAQESVNQSDGDDVTVTGDAMITPTTDGGSGPASVPRKTLNSFKGTSELDQDLHYGNQPSAHIPGTNPNSGPRKALSSLKGPSKPPKDLSNEIKPPVNSSGLSDRVRLGAAAADTNDSHRPTIDAMPGLAGVVGASNQENVSGNSAHGSQRSSVIEENDSLRPTINSVLDMPDMPGGVGAPDEDEGVNDSGSLARPFDNNASSLADTVRASDQVTSPGGNMYQDEAGAFAFATDNDHYPSVNAAEDLTDVLDASGDVHSDWTLAGALTQPYTCEDSDFCGQLSDLATGSAGQGLLPGDNSDSVRPTGLRAHNQPFPSPGLGQDMPNSVRPTGLRAHNQEMPPVVPGSDTLDSDSSSQTLTGAPQVQPPVVPQPPLGQPPQAASVPAMPAPATPGVPAMAQVAAPAVGQPPVSPSVPQVGQTPVMPQGAQVAAPAVGVPPVSPSGSRMGQPSMSPSMAQAGAAAVGQPPISPPTPPVDSKVPGLPMIASGAGNASDGVLPMIYRGATAGMVKEEAEFMGCSCPW